MRYLLDTNIVSDLVRNPKGRVAPRIREVGCSSSVNPMVSIASASTCSSTLPNTTLRSWRGGFRAVPLP
jgi:predicted nucleic acid-binding protein